MKAYAYVIATDAGVAPNFELPMPTLAICKPKIRLAATPGDLVLAFTGKRISPEPHGVCWAGVVTEKQTFSEYWDDPQFAAKKPRKSKTPDNIYRQSESGVIQVPNSSHGPDSAARDIGGRYVLVFNPAWYFGSAAPILPIEFGLRLAGGRRGHRVIDLSNERWRRLEKWLDSQAGEIQRTRPEKPMPSRCGQRQRKCS